MNVSKDSPIKKRLIRQIQQRYKVPDSEIPQAISDLKRFVNVSHRIMTEPQVQIQYKNIKLKDQLGRKTKVEKEIRIINTTIQEIAKITEGKPTSLKEVHKKLLKFTSKNGK